MTLRRNSLARRRAAMGYTQETFATRLKLDRSTVARWERGVQSPQPWNQADVAEALGITPEVLDQYLTETAASAAPGQDHVSLAPRRSSGVDLVAVAHLRQEVQALGARYDRTPSIPLLADAGPTFGQIALLAREAPYGRVRRELKAVESEAATLMGQLVWDASQRRDQDSARTYFDQAASAAREVGDIIAEGQAILRASYLALYGDRDPRAGLALTRHVAEMTSASSSALTGLALLHNAEAHAMLGDVRGCEIALADAEVHFDKITENDPAYHLFSDSQFARLAGSCYLFLGHHRRAQNILEKAARATGRLSKSRAIILGNLSLAQARQGEPNAAAAVLHEAIDIIEATRGGGGMNIAFDAARELRRWRAESFVQDLHDRLLALMTAA
ncbi:DNA-binding transcriptional regulator, XRE-family HTH domain [Actinokineospora terrae]|uniref:DNA-binding transcriptional regulator, XRE-family HTH domain n=2 Tax=Actinokineospora terrae TaxID=155974 RepID=A0A1H9WQG3_9PSEU|nr:DNA-binding transcriptional regulator, XRE-family HTH domain [Actinokineospora terrae]